MSSKRDRATFGTYSTNRETGLASIVRGMVKGKREKVYAEGNIQSTRVEVTIQGVNKLRTT